MAPWVLESLLLGAAESTAVPHALNVSSNNERDVRKDPSRASATKVSKEESKVIPRLI